ncbi:hypothetical protein [Natronorubrum bangense]|uniref:Homing endonuclease LAGLIDADG domain-containing protein n=2 Tax=Natronorubrum bangense TaxID=61858 RepID=L9WNE1_9EURY|nr:hypothetical protein [Natronorubrum bangense]ELY49863.1 hypothetical protein C494_07630 [Natronorubrum bangense JCM 10635]QCC55482.1 hypothetical protein DV706_14000 [Natronorubrum bangense]
MEEEFELAGAYVAGVIDGGSSITAVVWKQKSALLGYEIRPQVSLQRQNEEVLYVIDDWAREHGVRGRIEEKSDSTMWTLENREDVRTFLQALQPYLIVNDNVANLVLEELLPRLEAGTHRTKEGFLETMEYVDMIRDEAAVSQRKYDREYFEELWEDEISNRQSSL